MGRPTTPRGLRRIIPSLAAIGLLSGFLLAHSVSAAIADDCTDSETWTGTTGADTRYDSSDSDFEQNTWWFLDGDDYGRSLDCEDPKIIGDLGGDDIGGGSDKDTVEGQNGHDFVFGGQGNDYLTGGSGNDLLDDDITGDVDNLFGDDGNDNIDVLDGDGDDLAAGMAGTDDCDTDHSSERSNCET